MIQEPMPETHPTIPPELWRRVRMTVGCRDTDPIPKVDNAGEIVSVEDGTAVQIMHNGVEVVAGGYHGEWMSEIIRRLAGHHEPQEEWAYHQLVQQARPGGVMIELGCFWAYYALWYKKMVPNSTVYLIEPDASSLALARRNFALNDFSGSFHQYSVGRSPLDARLFICESDGMAHDVAETSVDAFLQAESIPEVELLLADIQGAELEMLRGAETSIRAGKIRFVVVSTHHHSISGDPAIHANCLAFIRDHGGHVLVEHAVSESFSGDGLIVASFRPEDRAMPPIVLSRNQARTSLFGET